MNSRASYYGYKLMYAITPRPAQRRLAVALMRLARRAPPLVREPFSLLPGVDAAQVVEGLRATGVAGGLALPADTVLEVREFCRGRPALVNRVRERWATVDLDGEVNPCPDGIVYAYQNAYRECLAVRRVVHDPLLVDIARDYLGFEPRFVGCQIWWSYPYRDAAGNPLDHHFYGYHYDMDDYRFLKFFFYLNDVGPEHGPHVVIEGTHRRRDAFERAHKYLDDDAVARRFGKRERVITGPAGTGFAEDTFNYHKGRNPQRRRLVLQVEYALNDWGGMQSDDYR